MVETEVTATPFIWGFAIGYCKQSPKFLTVRFQLISHNHADTANAHRIHGRRADMRPSSTLFDNAEVNKR